MWRRGQSAHDVRRSRRATLIGVPVSWKRAITLGGGYPFAVLAVVAVAVVLLPLRTVLVLPALMLLFVPVIIGVARLLGARAAAASALAAFLVVDLLFIPPYYRLTVASLSEWLGLLVFLIVALLTGQQTARLRQRERASLARQRELELLNRLSSLIAFTQSVESTARFTVEQVAEVMGADRVALYEIAEDTATVRCLAQAGSDKTTSGELALAAWVARTGSAIGGPLSARIAEVAGPFVVGVSDAIAGVVAQGVFLPLQNADSVEGALFVDLGEARTVGEAEWGLLVAITNLVAASLARQRLEEQASHVNALREADRLKSTLVSSVSHELKTPLAAATARITGLIEEGGSCSAERTHEELLAVADDLDRLNQSIGDLLDFSRLESDAWKPCIEDQDVRDILGTVLSRFSAEQQQRIRFVLADDVPDVRVDFAQMARAITNLVDNALAYSPPGTPVTVGTEATGDEVRIWVQDEGPGVEDSEKTRVFEKFYRGVHSAKSPAGTGLGLAITSEIVRTHDGLVFVEDVPGSGARFVVSLPTAEVMR